MILALALASAAPPATVPADRLSTAFMDVCLDGAGKFSKSDLSLIAFRALPKALKQRLGSPKSGQVWRINSPGHSYLYVLDYQASGANNSKICGLASTDMPLLPATKALEQRVDGYPLDDKLRSMEWWRPEDSYAAIATTASEYNVLQIVWLSDAQRKKALKRLRQVGVRVPPAQD